MRFAQGPGETLGDLRERELRCACDVLGVVRLDVWRYADGGVQNVPHAELAERILTVLREWQPQVVITFGPDGITSHPDHLAIGAATEQACQQFRAEHDSDRPYIYYVTIAPERTIEHPMGDAPAPRPASAIVDVSAYAAIKRRALECHASQRDDWQPLAEDQDWLTTDRFHRAWPPVQDDAIATTILDA